MKSFIGFAALCAALALTGCVTFHGNPALRPIYAGQAAPEIEKALTTPMDQLYTAAQVPRPNAYQKLDLGLAMFAGRKPPPADPADIAAATDLDARLSPRMDTYLAAHPGRSPYYADWTKLLGVTPEDRALAGRYLGHNLPDYWLSEARISGVSSTLYIYSPPACLKCSGGTIPIDNFTADINEDLIETAEHCVLAVGARLA